MEQFIEWITLNIDKIFIWFTSSTLGSIILVYLGRILSLLFKTRKLGRSIKELKSIKSDLSNLISEIKDFTKQTIIEENEKLKQDIYESFNNIQTKVENRKKEIYNSIFKSELKFEEVKDEIVSEKVVETPKKVVDLL